MGPAGSVVEAIGFSVAPERRSIAPPGEATTTEAPPAPAIDCCWIAVGGISGMTGTTGVVGVVVPVGVVVFDDVEVVCVVPAFLLLPPPPRTIAAITTTAIRPSTATIQSGLILVFVSFS